MTDNHETTPIGLMACPTCGKEMSTDADACPACGGPNTWVHPTLTRVIAHLNTLPRETRYEARGHRMVMQASHQTPRQAAGTLLMVGGTPCLVIGFFAPAFVMIGLSCIVIGGLLSFFGLNVFTRHELTLDLRVPGAVVGTCDAKFWSEVLLIVRSNQNPARSEAKPSTERPLWS